MTIIFPTEQDHFELELVLNQNEQQMQVIAVNDQFSFRECRGGHTKRIEEEVNRSVIWD